MSCLTKISYFLYNFVLWLWYRSSWFIFKLTNSQAEISHFYLFFFKLAIFKMMCCQIWIGRVYFYRQTALPCITNASNTFFKHLSTILSAFILASVEEDVSDVIIWLLLSFLNLRVNAPLTWIQSNRFSAYLLLSLAAFYPSLCSWW